MCFMLLHVQKYYKMSFCNCMNKRMFYCKKYTSFLNYLKYALLKYLSAFIFNFNQMSNIIHQQFNV